jgi:hypothetical protein
MLPTIAVVVATPPSPCWTLPIIFKSLDMGLMSYQSATRVARYLSQIIPRDGASPEALIHLPELEGFLRRLREDTLVIERFLGVPGPS